MKNLSLNLLNGLGNACRGGRELNQPTNGGNNGRSLRLTPSCYNCGELGRISLHCHKPPRQEGDMYPFLVQIPNCSN